MALPKILSKNYWFPIEGLTTSRPEEIRQKNAKNVNAYITPVQLQRLRHDVLAWRDAVREAEQAYYPHRVKMQRMFQDTILNGHVYACMQKRKNLTLLRDFAIYKNENSIDEKTTKTLQSKWFLDMIEYIMDARFYGYSLIGFGDVVDGELPNLRLIRRHNISPDRHNIAAYIYSLSGINFNDPEVKDENGNSFYDWTLWVETQSEIGVSVCGYGLLYRIALYEIFLRNLIGFNGDFIEMFAQPYRVGKTTKTTEAERAELEAALRNMGSAGFAIIDHTDDIAFLESSLGGNGYRSYNDFEKRLEAKISKIVLGHADALDSTPGKLGANDNVTEAISEIQSTDARFIENIVNKQLFPKLRNIGIAIPEGVNFKYKNDKEREDFRQKEDESNLKTAQVIVELKKAGWKVDENYITERTGIPVIESNEPMFQENKGFSNSIKNKLENLYGHKH